MTGIIEENLDFFAPEIMKIVWAKYSIFFFSSWKKISLSRLVQLTSYTRHCIIQICNLSSSKLRFGKPAFLWLKTIWEMCFLPICPCVNFLTISLKILLNLNWMLVFESPYGNTFTFLVIICWTIRKGPKACLYLTPEGILLPGARFEPTLSSVH